MESLYIYFKWTTVKLKITLTHCSITKVIDFKSVNHHIWSFAGFIQFLILPVTLLPPFSHFFLLPYRPYSLSHLFLSASSSSSFWPFLLFSARCNRIYHFLGDPVHTHSGRGIPSLSSATPCWGGTYYCFPPSSSSSSCAHTCASAIGHRGANHQCSHRPTWYSHGSPSPGTGQSNPSSGGLVPVHCAHICKVECSRLLLFQDPWIFTLFLWVEICIWKGGSERNCSGWRLYNGLRGKSLICILILKLSYFFSGRFSPFIQVGFTKLCCTNLL